MRYYLLIIYIDNLSVFEDTTNKIFHLVQLLLYWEIGGSRNQSGLFYSDINFNRIQLVLKGGCSATIKQGV